MTSPSPKSVHTPDQFLIQKEGGYRRWSIPAQCWSGAEWNEESISLYHDNGEWFAHTEINQCVSRDLGETEIASLCAEIGVVQ